MLLSVGTAEEDSHAILLTIIFRELQEPLTNVSDMMLPPAIRDALLSYLFPQRKSLLDRIFLIMSRD
jgi:hypothetical protein